MWHCVDLVWTDVSKERRENFKFYNLNPVYILLYPWNLMLGPVKHVGYISDFPLSNEASLPRKLAWYWSLTH
jgi:hypothetical protein